MFLLGMLIGLVLGSGDSAFGELPQLVDLPLDIFRHRRDQEPLLGLDIGLVLDNPLPQVLRRQPVPGLKLHEIRHNAPEHLGVMLGAFPLADQFIGDSLVEGEGFEVVDGGGVLQDAGSDDGQPDWEDLWVGVLLVVGGAELQLGEVLRGKQGGLQVDGFLVVGVLVGVREYGADFDLAVEVYEDILWPDIAHSSTQPINLMSSPHQAIQQVPQIRLSESLLFFMSVCYFLW